LEHTLLLIQYSILLPRVDNRCHLVNALWKALEAQKLDDSEQALHLYAHVKYIEEEEADWKQAGTDVKQLCIDALDNLSDLSLPLLQHYEKYVEDKDKSKICKLY
jgi:hypothetical protein